MIRFRFNPHARNVILREACAALICGALAIAMAALLFYGASAPTV